MAGVSAERLLAALFFALYDSAAGLTLSLGLAKMRSPAPKQGAFRLISVPYHAIVVPRGDVTHLPAKQSLGKLLAYVPRAPVTDDLFVFLPGSEQPCEEYSQLMDTIGDRMRAVCLPYDNRNAIGELCGVDGRCYPDLRLEAFNGTFQGLDGNNIETRLVEALRYLSEHDGSSWSTYLSAVTGLPVWSRVRLSGHSQGAGTAALIGYYRELARVVQFSGVCDRSDWTMKLGPPVTPADRFYGFASRWDTLLCPASVQKSSWQAEGGLLPGISPHRLKSFADMTIGSLDGSHFIVSSILPPGCAASDMSLVAGLINSTCVLRAHDTTARNVWKESPYGSGLWQGLCGV